MPIDQYNFQQPSPSNMPGFMIFQNKNSKLYYFHCNDTQGLPFLFSQSYKSEDGAERGVKSVLKNAKLEKRYVEHIEDSPFFFRLKAGNYQEIARSKDYKSIAAMKEAKSLLIQIAKSKQPMAVVEQKVAPVVKQQKSAAVLKKNELPRHVFRIEIYEQEDHRIAYTGVIKHPINKTKHTFKGLNFSEIRRFILEQLPQHSTQVKDFPDMASLRILPKNGQQYLFSKSIGEVKVEMNVKDKMLNNIRQQGLLASLSIQPLFKSNSFTINKLTNINASINEVGRVVIPLSLRSLEKGTYRLSATFPYGDSTPLGMQGSCYFQVA